MDLLEWVKKHGLFDLTNGNQSYAAVNHVSLLHRQLQVVCLRCFIVPGQHGEGNDTTVHMTFKKKTPPRLLFILSDKNPGTKGKCNKRPTHKYNPAH